MGDCEKCFNQSEIDAIKKDLERNSAQHREFYDKLSVIAVHEGVAENQMQQILASISEIKSDLRDIKEAPAQSFNAVKMCLITAVISSVASGLVASLLNMIMK